jgi:hypothetical protein
MRARTSERWATLISRTSAQVPRSPAAASFSKASHLIEREAKLTRAPHKHQPRDVAGIEAAIASVPARRRQYANALVVADRLDVAAGAPRQFADRNAVLPHGVPTP